MKAKFLTLLILCISFHSLASHELSELKDLYDSTFSRDNSFCRHNNFNFELQIRSLDRYSESNDRDYGEYPFLNQEGIRYKINFNHQDIGRYRFIYAKEKECTKTLSIPFDQKEINLFFAQDNRPYPDLLVIMRYHPEQKKITLLEHTKIPIIDYYRINDKIIFSSYIPKTEMSRFDYEGETYNHLTSALPEWRSFDGKNIRIETDITFREFEWKHFFKNLEEFKSQFQWSDKEKSFQQNKYNLIINTQIKKRCLKVLDRWRCRSL